jgi:hypothetical protein
MSMREKTTLTLYAAASVVGIAAAIVGVFAL